TFDDSGVAVTGFSGGGKTGTLLAFMSRGARFVADDRLYVPRAGRRMYGVPEPIAVKERYLQDLPAYRDSLPRKQRLRLRALRSVWPPVRAAARALPEDSFAERATRRVVGALERRLSVSVRPERLFGREACALQGPLTKLFLTIRHDLPEVMVRPL